jgi:PilZ domain
MIGKGVNPMGSKREFSRVTCDSPCILNYDGFNYQALLDNISLNGALIKVGNEQLDGLFKGARVELLLCSNPDLCPTKYTCEVIRYASSDIGVNFLKMGM